MVFKFNLRNYNKNLIRITFLEKKLTKIVANDATRPCQLSTTPKCMYLQLSHQSIILID